MRSFYSGISFAKCAPKLHTVAHSLALACNVHMLVTAHLPQFEKIDSGRDVDTNYIPHMP